MAKHSIQRAPAAHPNPEADPGHYAGPDGDDQTQCTSPTCSCARYNAANKAAHPSAPSPGDE